MGHILDSPGRETTKDAKPLIAACLAGKIEDVKALVEEGADVNAPIVHRVTPLHFACLIRHVEIARYLIAAGADVNAKSENGNSPLHTACEYNWAEGVNILIAAGADANSQTKDGDTPLHLVVFDGQPEIARSLIAAGADLRANYRGLTLLHRACRCDNLIMAKILIEAGGDLSAKSAAGHTAFELCKTDALRALFPKTRAAVVIRYVVSWLVALERFLW